MFHPYIISILCIVVEVPSHMMEVSKLNLYWMNGTLDFSNFSLEFVQTFFGLA